MTSLATIIGLLPTALGLEKAAEANRPLALAVTGGLASSTVLSLFIVRDRVHLPGGGRATPDAEAAHPNRKRSDDPPNDPPNELDGPSLTIVRAPYDAGSPFRLSTYSSASLPDLRLRGHVRLSQRDESP